MTPKQQQIAIAEACGWRIGNPENSRQDYRWWIPPGKELKPNVMYGDRPPDYLNDLNAMKKAENSIPQPSDFYRYNLIKVCGEERRIHLATAAQRAEAFLYTLGKWKEDS